MNFFLKLKWKHLDSTLLFCYCTLILKLAISFKRWNSMKFFQAIIYLIFSIRLTNKHCSFRFNRLFSANNFVTCIMNWFFSPFYFIHSCFIFYFIIFLFFFLIFLLYFVNNFSIFLCFFLFLFYFRLEIL